MTTTVYTVYSDGGARGNPGPAAIGAVIQQHGRTVHTISRTIGTATNNQAEYQAVHAALEYLHSIGARQATCYLDSELVVHQLNGKYRIKNSELGAWYVKIRSLVNAIGPVTFVAIPREKNAAADALVNRALDNA